MGFGFHDPPDTLEELLKLTGFLAVARSWGSVLRFATRGPTCVGEVVAGLFMGPVFLDIVPFASELAHVGLFGVMALQFSVGSQIRFDNVWLVSNKVYGAAFLFAFLPGLLTYLVLLAFRFPQKESIAGGIAMLPASTRSALILHNVIEPFEKVSSTLLVPATFICDTIALMAMAAMRNVGREGEGGEGWWPPIQSVIMSIIFMNAAIVFRRTIPNIVEPLLVSLSLGVTHENPTRVAVLEMIVYIVAAAVVGAMMLACETFASTFVLGALMAGVAVGLPRTLSVLCERRAAGYLPWLALLFFAASAGFEAPGDVFTDVEGVLGGLAIAGVATAGRVLPTLMLTTPVRDMDASRLSRACQAATCLLARDELALVIIHQLREHLSDRSVQMLYWAVIFTSVLGSLSYRALASLRAMEPSNRFGIGVLWLIKKGKLIVTGFSPASAAKELGVKMGDILKSVDGHNVLFMVPDEEGHHEASKLLRGAEGSYCRLEMLRVKRQAVEQKGESTLNSTQDTQASRSTELETYVVYVPRVAEIELEDPGRATY